MCIQIVKLLCIFHSGNKIQRTRRDGLSIILLNLWHEIDIIKINNTFWPANREIPEKQQDSAIGLKLF